jgi:Calx-beta domain
MMNARLEQLGKLKGTIIVAAGCLLAALAVGLILMAQPARAICDPPPCTPEPGDNQAPTVLVNNPSVTVPEGQPASNSGTYDDPDQNNVDLSASPLGSVSKTSGTFTGNWTWSYPTSDNLNQTITITASDSMLTSNAQFNLTVTNVAPTATGISAPDSVNEGSPINFSLAGVSDPSSVDMGSLQYSFACGGGAFSSTSNNTRTCSTTDNGTLTVRGRVRDKDGGQSLDYSKSVTINHVAPTATPNAPQSATAGTNFAVSLTNPSDPSSADTAAGFTHAFDCTGDGIFDHSGTSNSAACTAGNGPSQTVRYRITDKDGASSVYTRTVTILPLLTISDVRVSERSTNAFFTIRLSAPSQQSVTVNYATANGSARAPADYLTRRGALTFNPGVTTQRIAVPIRNDRLDERTEFFSINLFGANNATIADGSGRGTIIDNDKRRR